MSSDNIQLLLQECLSAYEGGRSPEECLSVFPEQRHVLEPLMRQALRLRVAYASAPRPEFRREMREKLLFAGGREVTHAYGAEPDSRFVSHVRQRLIYHAGAEAQEALRAVPPPHLPFWVNARRRLLESAAAPSPRLRTAGLPMTLMFRTALSAAVVVLAFAVAGLTYLTLQPESDSVGAQIASLEHQLDELEEQTAAGQVVSPTVLIELTRKTNELVEKLNDQPSTPLTASLPDIIERQRDVVTAAVVDSPAAAPELMQAQAQLNQVEEKVKVLASRAETPAPEATPESTAAPSRTATATPKPSATATPAPILARQVRIRLLPSDTTYGLSWTRVQTAAMSFVIPTTWDVTNVTVDSSGLAILDSDWLLIAGRDTRIAVNIRTGEITSVVNGVRLGLREEGKFGKVIDAETLTNEAGTIAPTIQHMLSSLEIGGSLGGAN